jgi:hypothetical protein
LNINCIEFSLPFVAESFIYFSLFLHNFSSNKKEAKF